MQHGQGQIWRAQDLLFDTVVALKLIRAELAYDDASRLRLQDEATAGARLGRQHPNIVRVFDLNAVKDQLYFAMEWLAGGTLQPFCGRVTLRRAITIMSQLASALAAAHAQGIVHSDVAPANVLFDGISTFKLADFGYLHVVDSVLMSRGSHPMQIGGRPQFMPPAFRLNPQVVDRSMDTYALAVTLFVLLTGTMPVLGADGFPEVTDEILVRHEQRLAPESVRRLFNRFTRGRLSSDQGAYFLHSLREL
jgi:serine/threonine-protein kinase